MQDLVGSAGGGYVVNDVIGGAEELAEKMQEFYGVIEAELRRGVQRGAGVSAEQGDVPGQKVEEDEKEDAHAEEEEEARIRDVLETVEATLCSLLYDRYTSFTSLVSSTRSLSAQAVHPRGERRLLA